MKEVRDIIKIEHFENYIISWGVVRQKTFEEIIRIIEDFRDFDSNDDME
ncbi:MAG: hypothetical protein PHD20_05415 [Clostridia bacterium]|nr:hypothetical protein [Clostridia bacterium]MDD4779027.1 hypothetical protein [Tissierellia bacterium]